MRKQERNIYPGLQKRKDISPNLKALHLRANTAKHRNLTLKANVVQNIFVCVCVLFTIIYDYILIIYYFGILLCFLLAFFYS